MDRFTLYQPPGNNQCGFYAMWAMHQYTGDDCSAGDQLVRIYPFYYIS
jgi:hypothetical protein